MSLRQRILERIRRSRSSRDDLFCDPCVRREALSLSQRGVPAIVNEVVASLHREGAIFLFNGKFDLTGKGFRELEQKPWPGDEMVNEPACPQPKSCDSPKSLRDLPVFYSTGYYEGDDTDEDVPGYLHVFLNQEDAKAFAVSSRKDMDPGYRPSRGWKWDGFPPDRTTLGEHMDEARRDGQLGVCIVEFDPATREWIATRQLEASEPLR